MTGGGGGAAFATVIANAGSEALLDPSLALITIPGSVPTFAADGVPASWPVAESKFAQAGLAAIAKVSFAPLASLALGRNMYALETIAWVAGVPEMLGGGGGAAVVTVIVNAGREAVCVPSLTLIVIGPDAPTLAAAGVPLSLPVVVSNAAHEGLPVMAKVSVLALASEALG